MHTDNRAAAEERRILEHERNPSRRLGNTVCFKMEFALLLASGKWGRFCS